MKVLKLILLMSFLMNFSLLNGQTYPKKKLSTTNKDVVSNKTSKNPLVFINTILIGEKENILSIINPNDIKSIVVLKNDAALEMFEDKAKNGAILITLKDETINSKEKLFKAYSLYNKNTKQIIISGVITNTVNQPIIDALAFSYIKNETYKTDSKGIYSLKTYKNDVITYLLEGYKAKIVGVKNDTIINIVLTKLDSKKVNK